MSPHLLSLFYCKNAATNMLNIISYALIVIFLLMLFMTPVGLCLLLASPFWTVGMEVVFYFVEHHYPGKVVAAVSAVVAVLFAVIVRFIWVVLLLQGGPANDEEAVSAGHRVIHSTAAGKYDGQPKEAPGADDLAVVARSSLSANRSRIGHSNPEYPSLVGGSRPNLRLLEKDVDSADLLSSKPRMPEGGDAYAHHSRLYSYATLACDVCIAATAAAVDKEFRGLAVPCTCGVAHASVCSFEVDSRHGSPSGVTACSTGVSDGAFVASAANVADMMGAVDAPSVSGSCVPCTADPLGEVSAGMPSAAAIGADAVEGVVATDGSDNAGVSALSGAAGDLGAGSAGTLVISASAATGASGAFLVRLLAPSFGSVLGSKRCIEDEDCASGSVAQVQAKKRKVAPLGDVACFSRAILEDPAAVASGNSAFGANPVLSSGGIISTATASINDDPMDICVPPSSLPLCPSAMDVDSIAACLDSATTPTTAMDLDHYHLNRNVWEPTAMDISTDDVSFLPPVCDALTASSTAAITMSTLSAATRTTLVGSMPTTFSAATTAQRRHIAHVRAPSELRRAAIFNAARQQQQQQPATAHTSSSTASSFPAHVTISNAATAMATLAASADTNSNATHSSKAVSATATVNDDCSSIKTDEAAKNNTATSSTPNRLELEEFDLDPTEILDPKDYPKENHEYDEFDGFDFSSQ
ncbi:hypothetical protein MBANPS3_009912, partial [Mucor bainieri]